MNDPWLEGVNIVVIGKVSSQESISQSSGSWETAVLVELPPY